MKNKYYIKLRLFTTHKNVSNMNIVFYNKNKMLIFCSCGEVRCEYCYEIEYYTVYFIKYMNTIFKILILVMNINNLFVHNVYDS